MYRNNKDTKLGIKKLLKNKTVLITGGAGSIGSSLTKTLLSYPIKSIRVFDLNEHALFKLSHSLNDSRIEPLFGNILDKDRIELAVLGSDVIIHTAALKNIEITEYNPIETIDVNVNGTINLKKSIIKNKPKIFINISTDKLA